MKVWIHIDGVQEGPFELEQLPWDRITPDTPVWYDGLPQWLRASDAPAVAEILAQKDAQSQMDQDESDPYAQPDNADDQPQQEMSESHAHAAAPQAAAQNPYAQPAYARAAMAEAAYEQRASEQDVVPTAYLVWAIITTLLCCSPFSIAAILTWGTARRKNGYGDIPGAKKWANATAWLIMISIVLSLAAIPFALIINSI